MARRTGEEPCRLPKNGPARDSREGIAVPWQDISGNWATLTNRADMADKWAPLAGPGGWNDPGEAGRSGGGLQQNDSRRALSSSHCRHD